MFAYTSYIRARFYAIDSVAEIISLLNNLASRRKVDDEEETRFADSASPCFCASQLLDSRDDARKRKRSIAPEVHASAKTDRRRDADYKINQFRDA